MVVRYVSLNNILHPESQSSEYLRHMLSFCPVERYDQRNQTTGHAEEVAVTLPLVVWVPQYPHN